MVTLSILLRNDPAFSYLDNVSVYNGNTQTLVNGGFETGSLSPWTVSFPYGGCQNGGVSGTICHAGALSGSYSYCDGCNTVPDELSQSFMAVAGDVYIVSFWLETGSTANSGISTTVTIT
jgi:hypothetical protein